MKKKRKACYHEIIDLHKELEIYHKLCRGKCKEYAYYSDWREHIEKLFSGITSNKRKNDFRALLRLRQRNAGNLKGFGESMMLFAMTIYLDKIIPDYQWNNNDTIDKGDWLIIILNVIIPLLLILAFLWMCVSVGKNALSEGRVKSFYSDLLEILDETEIIDEE